MKIFLVGMPGCGKTTLGKQLSRLLDLPFIDLDTEIELLARTTISEIFQQHGEAYFREMERDTLDKLIHERESFVMATGGGAPCFHHNMQAMNQAGLSVYIDIPSQEIINRMSKKGIAERPLFKGMDVQNMVEAFDKKFSPRVPFYKRAKIEISGDYVTPERIIHLISLHTKENNSPKS